MRNQIILLLVTIALIVITACAPVSPQSDTGEADQPKPPATFEEDTSGDLIKSGVEGQVFIGPVCAVVQSGKDCDDRPFQSRITVLNADVESVAYLETDEEGRFQILLAPGTYTLRPETLDAATADTETESGGLSLPASERYPYAEELSVTVVEGQFTQVTITFESGIR